MKIIIPMAGRGSRLRPHTLTIPKPLIPIAGKPIVQRLVEDIVKVCEKKVDENYDSVAFSIFPAHIEEVMRVADNKLTMPPKSTWFDPKPLDGLVVYEFNQES